MTRFITSVSAATIAVAALLLAGCSSTGKSSHAGHGDHAIACPKCDVVYVASNRRDGPRVERFQFKQEMTCPTCDKTAAAYFTDEKAVLHECPDCKVTPKVYTRPAPMQHAPHSK